MNFIYLQIRHGALAACFAALVSCSLTNVQTADVEQEATNTALAAMKAEQLARHDEVAGQVNALVQGQAELDALLKSLAISVDDLRVQNATLLSRQAPREKKAAIPDIKVAIPAVESSKVVFGRVEWLWFVSADRYFASQLDTGLDMSLIYADNITNFERNGKSWVRFTLLRNEWQSEIEAPVMGSEKQRYLGSSLNMKGPVVSLPVELGAFKDSIKFMVLNRKSDYPQVVLGKNFLTDIALVDVAQKYTSERKSEYLDLENKREQLARETSANVKADEVQ